MTEFYREYAGAKKRRFKPIIISHHMLMGLKEGQEKMSKSKFLYETILNKMSI